MLSNKRILVTGGGGFLGYAIIERLVEKKCDIRSLSRQYYASLSSYNIEQFQGNISNSQIVDEACRNVDIVFHVAAKPGIWGPYQEYYETNVVGTLNIIHACLRHKVQALIYTSSPSVIFNGSDMEGVNESVPYPKTYHAYYPMTKALAEKHVVKASTQIPTIILRPHLIWGPRDNHLTPRIISKAKKLFIIGDGSNLVDTTYIDTAADAHIAAAEQILINPSLSGNKYFITQGEPIPIRDMINHILNAAGLPPVTRKIPKRLARFIGYMNEIVYRIFQLKGEPQMTRFLADELSTAHWFDISAAKKDLQFVPKITIQQGLEKLKQWLKNQTDPLTVNRKET